MIPRWQLIACLVFVTAAGGASWLWVTRCLPIPAMLSNAALLWSAMWFASRLERSVYEGKIRRLEAELVQLRKEVDAANIEAVIFYRRDAN